MTYEFHAALLIGFDHDLRTTGNSDLLCDPRRTLFHVTGNKRPTPQHQREAQAVVRRIYESGLPQPVLVSGGSRGIEATAIREALAYKIPVIVVVGHGLDYCYPEEHRGLFDEVLERGGVLVSMFEDDQPVRPAQFVQRLELVSFLANFMVVGACSRRSGSRMLAARLHKKGTPVYALPQTSGLGADGGNYLIADGVAQIIPDLAAWQPEVVTEETPTAYTVHAEHTLGRSLPGSVGSDPTDDWEIVIEAPSAEEAERIGEERFWDHAETFFAGGEGAIPYEYRDSVAICAREGNPGRLTNQ